MITAFKDEYRFLSNFWPVLVTYDGLVYNSAEAAYQAQKFAPPMRRHVAAMSAWDAKRAGKQGVLPPDWDRNKLYIMNAIVTIKFWANPELADRLLSTGHQPLIEGNTWGDTYWGVCNGAGANHLGLILMRVREELRKARQP